MSKPKLRGARAILGSLRGRTDFIQDEYYGFNTTPVTPVTELKPCLNLQRLHHRDQRGQKPLCTNFEPISPLWVDLIA